MLQTASASLTTSLSVNTQAQRLIGSSSAALQVTGRLTLRLVTRLTIDIGALGLSWTNGIRYRFRVQDDFVRETDDNQTRIPAVDLFNFQRPDIGSAALTSTASVTCTVSKFTGYTIALDNPVVFEVFIRYNPGRLASLFVDDFDLNLTAVRTLRPVVPMTSTAEITVGDFRARLAVINVNAVFTQPLIADGWRARLAVANITSTVSQITDAVKITDITDALASSSVLSVLPRTDFSAFGILTANTTKTITANFTVRPTLLLTATATVSVPKITGVPWDQQSVFLAWNNEIFNSDGSRYLNRRSGDTVRIYDRQTDTSSSITLSSTHRHSSYIDRLAISYGNLTLPNTQNVSIYTNAGGALQTITNVNSRAQFGGDYITIGDNYAYVSYRTGAPSYVNFELVDLEFGFRSVKSNNFDVDASVVLDVENHTHAVFRSPNPGAQTRSWLEVWNKTTNTFNSFWATAVTNDDQAQCLGVSANYYAIVSSYTGSGNIPYIKVYDHSNTLVKTLSGLGMHNNFLYLDADYLYYRSGNSVMVYDLVNDYIAQRIANPDGTDGYLDILTSSYHMRPIITVGTEFFSVARDTINTGDLYRYTKTI